MMTGFVYKWIDTSNGMYYIGCHKGDVNDGYIGSGTYFLKAYNKRPKAFVREVLYLGEHFAELEDFMLTELNASQDKKSYNLTNACRGQYEYTSEIKEKISKAHKGKVTSEATKRKMSAAAKGVPKSKEHRKAVAESLKGKFGADARNKVAVYCAYLDKEFATIKECAEALGVSRSVVQNVFYGRTKNNKYGFKKIDK
jgi:hypothetical protein